MRVLITGGAGFIGSHMTEYFVSQGHDVCVADRFTYAGKGRNLQAVLDRIHLLIGDLSTGDLPERCAAWRPDWVVHMAAETHVDRAIEAPEQFIISNVLGTTRLLQALWTHHVRNDPWYRGQAFETERPSGFSPQKIIVYSTDEVFGSTPPGRAFDEQTPFCPSNAYSASKVGVEGVARSFYVTHQMPIVVVRPCNTYGPRQNPEKVIPKFVQQMLHDEPVTVYNDGRGARDWLHAYDHARAIECLLQHGEPGESYNLGAGEEHTDLEIATYIFLELQALGHLPSEQKLADIIKLTPGRPGHDKRYMMDNTKLCALGWKPIVDFQGGFADTVSWNITNWDWWRHDTVELVGHG